MKLASTWGITLLIWILWDAVWRAAGLWRAAKRQDLGWFIALLLISSFGIVPIIYLITHKDTHWEGNAT